MENNNNILQNYQYVVEGFIKQGYSASDIEKFFSNNKDYFAENLVEADSDIYFICNAKKVYALLVVKDDSYWWSLYQDDEFQPLQRTSIDDDSSEVMHTDFIVEMMLSVADSKKMQNVIPEIGSMNVANKVKMLKKVGLNSNGYHVR